jgi:4-hydroxymandelate synthase
MVDPGGVRQVPDTDRFADLTVDHVRFYVQDIDRATAELVDGYGFAVTAVAGVRAGVEPPGGAEVDPAATEDHSVALGLGRITLVLTTPQVDDHPATGFVRAHGDGVADIALRTADAAGAFHTAVERGARPVSAPREQDGFTTASIIGFGDTVHTFVQHPDAPASAPLPGFRPVDPPAAPNAAGLRAIDHFAVCLEAGTLEPVVEFYRTTLGFEVVHTEHIVVGQQAMASQVVQSRSGEVTFTLLEPDTTRAAGQIDDFVKNHHGAGVQHVAFVADDIVTAVGTLGRAGVEFLATPEAYYRQLPRRLTLAGHDVAELQQLNVLADADHDGQLFQIFARSTHPRDTFFFEVIERLGATGFGSGNIHALYAAVAADRE